MDPVPVGSRIRVVRRSANHSYAIGGDYTVSFVDTDGTFKAKDAGGNEGDWLRWRDCEPGGPSLWDRIAADLPEDLALFLSAFDGIAQLSLKPRVIDAILAQQPDLHERVLALLKSPEGMAMVANNAPQRLPGVGSEP